MEAGPEDVISIVGALTKDRPETTDGCKNRSTQPVPQSHAEPK
jgi:hypothetical protein